MNSPEKMRQSKGKKNAANCMGKTARLLMQKMLPVQRQNICDILDN